MKIFSKSTIHRFTPVSSVDEIVNSIPKWHKLGVRIIGGCCEVTPEGIAKIAEECKKLKISGF